MTTPYSPDSNQNPVSSVHPSPQSQSSNPYAPNVSSGDASNRTLGILSLVGGIASIIFGQTVLIPVAAIVLGFLALNREPLSRSFAIWGIVLGIVALFGWIILAIIGFAFAAPFFFVGF